MLTWAVENGNNKGIPPGHNPSVYWRTAAKKEGKNAAERIPAASCTRTRIVAIAILVFVQLVATSTMSVSQSVITRIQTRDDTVGPEGKSLGVAVR